MAFVPSVGPSRPAAAQTQSTCQRASAFYGTAVPSTASRAAVPSPRPTRSNVSMTWGKTFTESLELSGNYKCLLGLVKACRIDLDSMQGTLFAPDDNAFARLKPGTLEAWYKKLDVASAMVTHHFVPGEPMTLAKIKGVGYWENTTGGPLSYEGLGGVVRVGGVLVLQDPSNRECSNGIIHRIESILTPAGVKPAGVSAGYTPSVPTIGDSVIESVYPKPVPINPRATQAAALPSTTGGRKAMGLMRQLPFWMYGPPFNAAVQEDYEPISIAQPEGASVDYQLMPPGSVIVTPDSVNANELNPVSGMSKYIGKTKKQVEGSGLSDYSRLNQSS